MDYHNRDAIKARVKLDYAVANAIGVFVARTPSKVLISPRKLDDLRGVEHVTCEGDVVCLPFSPSTDVSHAFAAAEKVRPEGGMFEVRRQEDAYYAMFATKRDNEVYLDVGKGSGPTPALALCAAILKLKENP